MKYDAARPGIKSGDLLAWSHGGWKTWHDIQVSFVRVFTRSEYSHVGMAWVVGGRVLILEAVGAGVRIYPLSRELPFYWVKNPQTLTPEALEWALAHIGDAYSKWQAILAGIDQLKRGADDIWECAEYFLGILDNNGQRLTDHSTPSAVVQAAAEQWGPITLVQ